jgi:cation diffusion facilitator family transporter
MLWRVSAVPAEAARDQSFASVATALAANVTIAAAKGTAAALTGSPALLAETLHTVADAGNEVLLWVALRRSRRHPDASHPLGYGPERYYWALLAAVGMFAIGGALSIWEGVNALLHPPPLESFWVGVAVLVIAIVLDSISRTVALRQLRKQAAARGLTVRELLRETPDPTVVTVYLEDSIDVLGAFVALAALVLHKVTGSSVFDALATVLIGLLLGYVAVKLISRNRQLLANQAIPTRYAAELSDRLVNTAGVAGVARLEAVYLGPGEVLAAADVPMEPGLSGEEVTAALARLRADAARDVPVITRLYLTPVSGNAADERRPSADTVGQDHPMTDSMAPGDDAPSDRNETAPDICPDCGGSGRVDGDECRTCAGTGEVQKAVGGG